MHDVGDSLSPLIDLGQIEGGFVQGAGWLTLEELRWDTSDGPHRGRLNTQAASTYKIPSFSEMPEEFNVHLFERATESGRGLRLQGGRRAAADAWRSASGRRCARRSARSGRRATVVDLGSPATPEAVYWAIEAARAAGCRTASDPSRPDRWLGSDMDWLERAAAAAPGGCCPACWSP